jgi:RHS repeat-associated protein
MLRIARRLLSLPLMARHVRPIRRTKPLPFQPRFDNLEDRIVPDGRPLPFPVIYVGAEFGAPPTVKAYDAETGSLNFERIAYESDFTGGIRVATADLTGDQFPDLIVAPGEGGGPRVRVLDGKTGLQIDGPLGNFWAYSKDFTGGVQVAAGDVNGDSVPDIMTAAGQGGGPHVKVFDGVTGEVIHNFYAFSPSFTGGVHLAAADFTGDRRAEIVVGAGYGGAPHVKIYNFATKSVMDGPLGNFYAFDPDLRSGVHVGTDLFTGDVTGDGRADLLVGGGKGMNPRVKVFDGVTGDVVKDFLAYDKTMNAGVRPASAFVTDDIFGDIIVGTGKGAETTVRVFDGVTGTQLSGAIGEYLPFGPGSLRGVNVAASNDPLYANPYISTSPGYVGFGQPFWITTFLTRPSKSDPLPGGSVDFMLNGVKVNSIPVPLETHSADMMRASFLVEGGGVGRYAGTAPYRDDDLDITYSGDANYASQNNSAYHGVVGFRPAVDCSCDPNLKAEEAAGSGNYGTTQTEGGIGFDGTFDFGRTDLTGGSFDQEFSQGWALSTSAWRGDSVAGAGSLSGLTMRIVQNNANQSLYVTDGGAGLHAFDQIGSSWDDSLTDTDPYYARYGSLAELTHDISGQRFVMLDGRGNKFTFYDFTVTNGARGRLEKMADENGVETTVSGWLTGSALTITRVTGSGGSTITEALTHSGSGTTNSVTLTRTVGAGSPVTLGSVDYTYPSGYGNSVKRLEQSTVKDASGNALDTSYYRYYTSGQPSFATNPAIKMVLGPAAYARAKAYADSISSTVAALSDSALLTYADHYLEYGTDSEDRLVVTKHVVAGDGCSSCSGGQGTYTYSYYSNPGGFVYMPNKWSWRVTETAPDGSKNVYYTNRAGELLMKVIQDAGSSTLGIDYFHFNDDWQMLMQVGPDGVSGYDEGEGDLVEYVSGNATYLRDADGAFTHYSYNADGLQESVSISRGETASEIVQSETEYVTRTVGSQDYFFPDSTTQYVNENGTGAEEWTTAYTWQGSTARIESITVTAPIVTTAHNGSNSATSTVTFMDAYGRPIWHKDEAGFISYTEYDSATGAVVKSITDVDTTQTGTFSNKPSGWTTPGGGGLHLTSTYEVDFKGRVTKSTAPNGRIDYTVYDDDNFEVRSYPGWNTSTNAPTGPTIVSREDRAKGYTESLTMSATPNVSSGRPTGTESIGSLQSLSRSYVNEVGQTVTQDEYFNLSGLTYSTAANIGTINTHYYRTTVAYTHGGQLAKTTSPLGTITRTWFDDLGRPISEWIGTDDTPTTGTWSPTNLTGTNMVKVSETEYDHGGIGPGNVTKQTLIPGGGAANRVTQTWYDLRNRPIWTKSGVEGSESTSTNRPISITEYDNLDRVVKSQIYDGDTVTVTDSNSDGVPDSLPSSSLLRSQSTASYDELGRVYLSEIYSVNPSGNIGSYTLKSNTWYDARGQVIKSTSPGGLVQKTAYDGAGRTTVSYVTDGGGDTGYSDADDVTGDKVLEQSEPTYDASGNVLSQLVRQRNHDETGTGALGTATTGNKARVSYVAYYYDVGDRTTAVASYGTYGASSWTRPGTVASRSDTVLVSSMTYDAAGRTYETTDPKALVNRTTYDALGRTLKTIENYVDGTVGDDNDKTTEYTYNAAGMTTLTAKLTGGGVQTTEWIYGVTTGGGSTITSNDISVETRWPDPSTGASSSSQKDLITINALGQTLTSTDRNGTVHTLAYDVLGRITTDTVTTLGTNINGAVRRVETAYDSQGNAFLLTNYDATTSGNIVNQVQRAFNGLGQLVTEYQSHSGAVNTGSSPKVQYAYSEMASGVNHSRPISMTYPNSRVLDFNYGVALDDSISRFSALKDGSTTLESYDYLGLGTVVKRGHAQSGVDLTYIKASGEGNGDAGDQYTGLDRFGRVVDQRWRTSSVEKDRYQYGYDRNGNRLYRDNLVNTAFGELYAYDNLNQLTSFDRGTLNGSKNGLTGAASRSQDWDYDALGNFDSVTTDGGSAVTRTHNKQNEITAVSGATSPVFDANGNMTTDETGKQYVYDAWNRLVTVKNSGGTTIASYVYDALSRRVKETASSVTTDLYYSAGWQVIEERVSGTATKSYVWSPVYVDAMVARDRDTDANGSLDERLYVMHDANFNVTGLVNTSGTVVERYTYDPYGVATVRDGSWTVTTTAYVWQYLHQGGRLSGQSGLYSFRYREYSPTLGRWLTMDPILYSSNSEVLYLYCSNSPHTLLDHNGLKEFIFTSTYSRGNDDKSETNYETASVVLKLIISTKEVRNDSNECIAYDSDFSLNYTVTAKGSREIWTSTERFHNDGTAAFFIVPAKQKDLDNDIYKSTFGNISNRMLYLASSSQSQKMKFTRSEKDDVLGATLVGDASWKTTRHSTITQYHTVGGAAYIAQYSGKDLTYNRQLLAWAATIDTKTGEWKLDLLKLIESHRTKLGCPVPDSVADYGGSEVEEGLVHGEGPVPADAEPTELVEPTERAFDNPADVPEALFALSASGDCRGDAQPSQDRSERAAVEPLVGDEGVRLLLGPARFPRYRRDVDDQRQGGSDVMGVGRGDLHD